MSVSVESITCKVCGEVYSKDQGWPLLTCPMCRVLNQERQQKIVLQALQRPMDKWAPRDLTLEQWVATLIHFNARCAYCEVKSYECLEHFIPLKLGGGTTVSNCVPSCLSCNKLKGSTHPTLVTRLPQEAIERVRTYLQQFS